MDTFVNIFWASLYFNLLSKRTQVRSGIGCYYSVAQGLLI